jgi:putative oxidoreductase
MPVDGGRRREQPDLHLTHPAIAVTGRVMLTLIFFLSGITHFTDMDGYVALMPPAIPFRPFWVAVSAIVEFAGATLVLTNRWPRLGGWLLALFLIPVTVAVHGVAMVTDPDARMRQIQLSFFLKGIAMTGAALLVTQLGGGGDRDHGPDPDAP